MANQLTALPAMPSSKKNRPVHACVCGCGMLTKSTWYTGHDGRATGWAMRVLKGVITIDEVPANERNGAKIMIAREVKKQAATGTHGK